MKLQTKPEAGESDALRSAENGYGSAELTKPGSVDEGSLLFSLGVAAKLMYFLRFGQQGVFYTYIAVYLHVYLGLSILMCGVVFTVMMIAQTVGSNTIPTLADTYSCHTTLAPLSHLCGSIVALFMMAVRRDSILETIVILGVSNILIGGCMPLSDSAVFQMCKKYDFNFGLQRLWGCLGWSVFTLVVALFNPPFTPNWQLNVFWYVYAGVAPFAVLTIWWLLHMVHAPVKTDASQHAPDKNRDAQGLPSESTPTFWHFATHPVVLPFLLSVAFMGCLFGSASVLWMSLWAVEDLHASFLVLSAAAWVLNLSELPMFFFAGDIGKRLGVHGVLYISSVVYIFWLLSYGYLVTSAWWLVPFQVLHGIGFSLQIGNVGAFTGKIATEIGIPVASAQGYKQGALNFGRAIGFICAGILYQVYSATTMFRVMGFCGFGMFFVVAALHASARRSNSMDILYLS